MASSLSGRSVLMSPPRVCFKVETSKCVETTCQSEASCLHINQFPLSSSVRTHCPPLQDAEAAFASSCCFLIILRQTSDHLHLASEPALFSTGTALQTVLFCLTRTMLSWRQTLWHISLIASLVGLVNGFKLDQMIVHSFFS